MTASLGSIETSVAETSVDCRRLLLLASKLVVVAWSGMKAVVRQAARLKNVRNRVSAARETRGKFGGHRHELPSEPISKTEDASGWSLFLLYDICKIFICVVIVVISF